jgi:translation initiation factor 2 beta subunit (eIF-2beta)/eIF-5
VSADLSPVDISAVLEIRNKVLKSDNLFDAIERINDMNKIYKNKMTTAGQINKNKNLISNLEEIKQDIVGKIDDQL